MKKDKQKNIALTQEEFDKASKILLAEQQYRQDPKFSFSQWVSERIARWKSPKKVFLYIGWNYQGASAYKIVADSLMDAGSKLEQRLKDDGLLVVGKNNSRGAELYHEESGTLFEHQPSNWVEWIE